MAYNPNQQQNPIPLTQQPQAQPGMKVAGNLNVFNKPYNSQGTRDWSHDLCDCFGDGNACLMASCVPCFLYSQNKTRLVHLEMHGRPHPNGGDMLSGDCCIYACLLSFGCFCFVQMNTRERIRTRYKITGNSLGDCCASWCCGCCGLIQESREIRLEEDTY